jgi:hypothetical protein
VTAVQVRVAFCDSGGIVLAEITQAVGLKLIPRDSSGAFGLAIDDLPEGVVICSEQPSAEPARADPSYTTALALDARVSYHQWRRDLTFEGPITNFGLSPVDGVQVILVAYDAENRVIGYAEAPLDATVILLPGQPHDFSAVIPVLGGQPDHVVTLVEAHVQASDSHSLAPMTTP